MYCKNCGRKLKDNARFCDRCGFSVKKTDTTYIRQKFEKRNEVNTGIDSYRKYKREQKRKEIEKQRKAKKTKELIILLVIAVILISSVVGYLTYIYVLKHSNSVWKDGMHPTGVDNTATTSDILPENTADASTPKSTSTVSNENASSQNSEKYIMYTDTTYGFDCPFPKTFEKTAISNSKTRLSIKDSNGDGEMMISAEKTTSPTSPKQLLKEYASGIGAQIDTNVASDTCYSISFTRNGKYNYRKAIVVDEKIIYFDFSYPSDSQNASEYNEYIKYIDNYLTQEANDLQKKSVSNTNK